LRFCRGLAMPLAMSDTQQTPFRVSIVPVTGFQQNCSIIFNDETKLGAVVDPGGDLDRIMGAIEKLGVTVEKILLTHGHIDHAGGAAELRDKLGVKIEGPHFGDQPLLQNLPASGARFGMTGVRAVESDRYLEDGDVVEAAGFALSVHFAPGHSPGSVVFFSADNRFALMGDVLFKNSVGRTDLPGGSHETLLKSIREKVLPLGDDVMFLPGHGQPSTIGEERVNNPFLTGRA
jgi:hydroxyacylglutathione hydrolase